MINKRPQSEIDIFLFQKNRIPVEIKQTTASSFSQQRDKMSFSAFKKVFEQYYNTFNIKKYFGY